MDKKHQIETKQRTISYKYSRKNMNVILSWVETHQEFIIARVQNVYYSCKANKIYVTLNYMTIKEGEVKATIEVLNALITVFGDGII